MKDKTPWIVSTLLLGGLCVGIALVPISMSRQLEEQAPRLERRDVYCQVEKFEATTASDNLRSRDKGKRDWGLEQFKTLSLSGWQMANMCSPITVGATCYDDDLPCQLAALALSTRRARLGDGQHSMTEPRTPKRSRRINVARALADITPKDAERIAERVRIQFRRARTSDGAQAMVPSDIERLLAIAVAAVRGVS